MSTYVRYRPDLEQPFPDEEELTRQVVAAMQHANEQVAAKHRHGLRDAHAKSHGILAGELRVKPDLPEHLSQGLFAEARSYEAWVRFSNANQAVSDDAKPDIRGLALKLMGVPREEAEKKAAEEPGDLAVFLCVDCAENGRHFTASPSFEPFSLRMF